MANDNIGKRSDRLVARQLRKSGVCAETNSSLETFVQRVRETYAEADEQRVLNEHAFKIASAEMADLNSQLEAKNEQLKQALESLTRSKQIERLNEELSSKNDALSRLANTDSLTGLLNRYSFSRSLQESATKLSDDEKLAVAIIDLDRFKLINDTFGHNVGDKLLIAVAENLQSLESEGDFVARLGGDEFALARVVKSEAQAKDFVKDLSRTLQKPLLVDELLIHGGGSVGLALSSPGDIDSVSLMRDADTAMYRSKENSDITYQIFDQKFREEVTRRYTLEREIRDSVAANEFRLVYQPIVCASSKETMLLEALSRWTSPTLGTVAPPEFIPIVERLGLSIEFGRLVTAKVCQQIRRWRDEYPAMENVAVTINFSSSQLLDHGLTAFIAKTLSDHNLEGSSIVIELTESDLLQDFDRAVSVLSELRDMGIKVAIDDFGTGYSALAYLPHIPADYLKIDKAFVQNMESDESVCRLTKIIVELADRFGLKSIGEGVEKELQSESLQKFGCDFIQGYLYGKPAETNDLPAMCDWDVAAESDTDYLAQKAA